MKKHAAIIVNITSLVIGALALLYTYSKETNKEISYEMIYSIPIVNIIDPISDHKIKVLFDEKERTDIYSTVIKIRNTGNLAIASDDLASPITIISNSDIYSLNVVSKIPEELKTNLSIDSETNKIAKLNFNLLNEGDSIIIEMITEGGAPSISLASHIKDTPSIKNITQDTNNDHSLVVAAYLIVTLILMGVIQSFFLHSWAFRNKEHSLLKYNATPYFLTVLTITAIKIPLAITLAEMVSSDFDQQFMFFIFFYSLITYIPEFLLFSKKGKSCVRFPDNLKITIIGSKKECKSNKSSKPTRKRAG